MKILKTVVVAAALLAIPCLVHAQERRVEIRGLSGFSASGIGGESVSMSVSNGIKTIKAKNKDGNFEIVDDPDNGITVKMTQRYGPDDAEKIAKKYPGLYMHLKSIPKTVNDAKVDIHVDVTESFEADDKDDLKNKHPAAFKIYEKYAIRSSRFDAARFGGGFGRGGRIDIMPPIEMRAEALEGIGKRLKEVMEKVELERIELKKALENADGKKADRAKVEVEKAEAEAEKAKSEAEKSEKKLEAERNDG